jgi:hypothetical protein
MRRLIFGSKHVDSVPIGNLVLNWHHASVHLTPYAAVAQLRMHAVREIYQRRALGEGIQIAFWGKDEDFLLKEILLDCMQKLLADARTCQEHL